MRHLARAVIAMLVGFVALTFVACNEKCKPRTCAEVGDSYCGMTDNGCAGTLICYCSLPETCGGNGVSNVCGEGTTLNIVITSSRTSGVVPLSVFFDTTSTPTFSDGSYIDATVLWNFDMDDTDPAGHYEKASGFVAAHVFEQPGSYRVRAQIYDAQGRAGFAELTIDAQAFAGTTYYVAAAPLGADSNTGLSMDEPVLTVRHALADLAQPNTRILFRNGDTFHTTFVGLDGRTGPVIIGGYSDPSSPSARAPIIYSDAADGDWSLFQLNNDDWRIMDLAIRSGGHSCGSAYGDADPRYPGGLDISTSATNCLAYRLELYELCGPLGLYGKYNTIAECNIHAIGSAGIYGSGSSNEPGTNAGQAVIGNRMHDVTDNRKHEHAYRFQGGSGAFIAFNDLAAGNQKSNLQIRGDSNKVVIYHNILDRSSGLHPQNASGQGSDEHVNHCVVDSNLFIRRTGPGYDNGYDMGTALGLTANYVTIRNNIFYDYPLGISLSNGTTVGPSNGIAVYNNTAIGISPGAQFIYVDEQCYDVSLANNLLYNDTAKVATTQYDTMVTMVHNFTAGHMTSDYNLMYGRTWDNASNHFFVSSFGFQTLAEWQVSSDQDLNSLLADPQLESIDPSSLSGSFARPAAASLAVGSGLAFSGIALDFYGNLRDQTPERGAVCYTAGAPPIPW